MGNSFGAARAARGWAAGFFTLLLLAGSGFFAQGALACGTLQEGADGPFTGSASASMFGVSARNGAASNVSGRIDNNCQGQNPGISGDFRFVITMNLANGDAVSGSADCTGNLNDSAMCSGNVDVAGSMSSFNINNMQFLSGSVRITGTMGLCCGGDIAFNVTLADSSLVVSANSDATLVLNPTVLSNDLRHFGTVLPNVTKTRLTQIASGEETLGFTRIAGGALISGASAGDGMEMPWGLWGSYQHNDFEDDFVGTAHDGDTDAVLVGADINPWGNWIFGVAFGYSQTDVDTTFNTGQVEYDALTIAPYMGAYISDYVGVNFDLSFDMAIAFSRVDVDQFRTAAGARVTSSTDTDRVFFSGNVNAGTYFGDLRVDGRAGLLVGRDDQDGFVESDGTVRPDREIDLGRFTIGAEAAYRWDAFEPFVMAFYEADFERDKLVTAAGAQPSNDPNGFLVGGGIRWFGSDAMSAVIEYSAVLGRDDFDSDTISVVFRADF